MSNPYPVLPPLTTATFPRSVHDVVNNIMRGKTNNTGLITLTAGAATTTLQSNLIGGATVVTLQPASANAAAALTSTWFSTPTSGSVVINHANNAQIDKTFFYTLTG